MLQMWRARPCVTCKKKQGNGATKDSTVEVLKEEGNPKRAHSSYAWGKVRELDALILFDPGSTHNSISHDVGVSPIYEREKWCLATMKLHKLARSQVSNTLRFWGLDC